MAQNQNPNPSTPTKHHSELVVGWYQQSLADAQLANANLWAQNQVLTARIQELTAPTDPNITAKGSDA